MSVPDIGTGRLFTRELVTNGATRYQIVVWGYDKFFNIGQVPWTTVRSFVLSFGSGCRSQLYISQWASLEAHTAAPYILSLKSNGCIIFFRGSDPYPARHDLQAVHGRCGPVTRA